MARGKVRSLRVHMEEFKQWSYREEETPRIETEPSFMENVITPRALTYASAVVTKLKLEIHSRTLPEGRARILIMLVQPVRYKFILRMNQAINLTEEERPLLTMADMYGTIGMIYYSPNSGYSLKKGIGSLVSLGCRTPSLVTCRYILNNFQAFPVTVRHEYLEDDCTLISKRHDDATVRDRAGCIRSVNTYIFVPLHQILTLDDNLIGSRAAYLEVKTLSSLKAHNERHMSDVLADSLFNCVLAVRFRRRGEGQEVGACAIL